MKKYKAFSLVELIVWITISMILMAWVWVFVSWWINNIVLQDKVIKNTADFRDFSKEMLWLFSRIDTRLEPKIITSTSALLKVDKSFDSIWVSFIWEENRDWYYCSWAWVDSTITKHIVVKNFLPFEEIGEDIFKNNGFTDSLSWNSWNFNSFYRTHIIKENWNIIIWIYWIFGRKIWDYWTWAYLNNPTWLAYDSAKKLLYISDTGNNRILVYNNDSSSSDYRKISKLLWEQDWLKEPMGLVLHNNDLYIVNSWKWEILKYSSKSTSKKLNLDLDINKNINNLKNFSIKIFTWITNISKPDSTSQFTLNWISKKSPDYLTWTNDTLTYWLTNFSNNFNTQSNKTCSSNYVKYYEESWDMIKEEIQNCNSSTGTLKKYKTSSYQNISSWTNIKISTSVDFDWTDFSKNQNYYLKLTLSGSSTFSKYFPFFVNWDDDLLTRNDNTLEVISNNFKYPTWIKYNWWKLYINDFWDRKEYSINLDWTWKSTASNLSAFNYSKIKDYKYFDYILKSPIKKLELSYDLSKKYFSFLLKYYKQYNCYDSDQRIDRTLILSKSFK